MILSRAFFYADATEDALKETLSSLPEDVLTDIKVATDKEMTSAERLVEVSDCGLIRTSRTSCPAMFPLFAMKGGLNASLCLHFLRVPGGGKGTESFWDVRAISLSVWRECS